MMFRKLRTKIARARRSWEDTCSRCGICCYEKGYVGGRIYINMRAPCRYLDTETRLCTVYEKRFKVCKDCIKVNIFHALFSGQMPENCGYVLRYRKWRYFIPNPIISNQHRIK